MDRFPIAPQLILPLCVSIAAALGVFIDVTRTWTTTRLRGGVVASTCAMVGGVSYFVGTGLRDPKVLLVVWPIVAAIVGIMHAAFGWKDPSGTANDAREAGSRQE